MKLPSARRRPTPRYSRSGASYPEVGRFVPYLLEIVENPLCRIRAGRYHLYRNQEVLHGSGCLLGSHEKATLHVPAKTLQLSSTAIWLLSLYPEALTVTTPIFRSLTPDAFTELTEIVALPPIDSFPDPGVTPNHAAEGAAMKSMA